MIRVLLLALFLQVLAPILGLLPNADAVTICTGHGTVTMLADGDGGWSEQTAPAKAGLNCSFCLPLLSGHAGPVADIVLPLPQPMATSFSAPAPLPPGQASLAGPYSPRAPPILR